VTAIPYDVLMAIQRGTMAYRYRGIPLLKNPFDLALYPLLLERAAAPKTLIEIGSHRGGSTMVRGPVPGMRVWSIDLEPPEGAAHPNVTFLRGELAPAVRPRP
jgi:cephalosporin hydroxylase